MHEKVADGAGRSNCRRFPNVSAPLGRRLSDDLGRQEPVGSQLPSIETGDLLDDLL